MASLKTKDISGNRRNLYQNASHSIRDVYDAIVELVTNADDRYQLLDSQRRLEGVGVIQIDVERRRKENKILKVRDFADGMTGAVMDQKLSNVGGRVSGMELGLSVRGTNSRGAKDVAALGDVSFKSFAEDGRFHECRITRNMRFVGPESSVVTTALRREVGIRSGTGTLVTIVLNDRSKVPHHTRMLEGIRDLVQLRSILANPRRQIILRDVVQARADVVESMAYEGKERLSESFHVPGYPATAKNPLQDPRHSKANRKSRRPGTLSRTTSAGPTPPNQRSSFPSPDDRLRRASGRPHGRRTTVAAAGCPGF